MVESLLIAVVRILTRRDERTLSNATGFFFARDERLFIVTGRHVVIDAPSDHRPDALAVELHMDPDNVAAVALHGVALYADGRPLWREGRDAGGVLDIAAIEIDRAALPPRLFHHAFTPAHLVGDLSEIEVGTRVLVAGFPLGFHDELHRLPVARQATIASAFGLRFQGHGYFLTDARLHRGMSGAPVVARDLSGRSGRAALPWLLLGIHAARMDVNTRDVEQDERLNLNLAWYADALMAITAREAPIECSELT